MLMAQPAGGNRGRAKNRHNARFIRMPALPAGTKLGGFPLRNAGFPAQ